METFLTIYTGHDVCVLVILDKVRIGVVQPCGPVLRPRRIQNERDTALANIPSSPTKRTAEQIDVDSIVRATANYIYGFHRTDVL